MGTALASNPPDIRDQLATLGRRRALHDAQDRELAQEIQTALLAAIRDGVSKSEAARLLGVHRTTLYRVYNV